MNFISRVFLAITDFRLYPFVAQKEKLSTAIGYFFKFVFLIAIVLSISTSNNIVHWLSDFATDYNQIVSEFSIKDGELQIEKDMNFDFLKVKIYTNQNESFNEDTFNSLELEDYRFSVLAFKDSVALGSGRFGYVILKYQDAKLNLDKENLYYKLTNLINSNSFKLSLTWALFCGAFIVYFVSRFLFVLFIGVMLMLFGLMFGIKYRYKDYLKVAFYIITLPTITEVIALMMVGNITHYANVTYYLLIYVYIFYAVRALKLDNIISMTAERMNGIKSEVEKANEMIKNDKEQEKDENTSIKKDDENKNDKEKKDNED